jgi:hypothetical protein
MPLGKRNLKVAATKFLLQSTHQYAKEFLIHSTAASAFGRAMGALEYLPMPSL